jgi:hypothetical protein
MLLESLITLTVIASIILLSFPLMTDWLILRNNEKDLVEHNRLLYETSMNWSRTSFSQTSNVRNVHYNIESYADEIEVFNQ